MAGMRYHISSMYLFFLNVKEEKDNTSPKENDSHYKIILILKYAAQRVKEIPLYYIFYQRKPFISLNTEIIIVITEKQHFLIRSSKIPRDNYRYYILNNLSMAIRPQYK